MNKYKIFPSHGTTRFEVIRCIASKHHTAYTYILSRWAASSEFGTYRLCEQRRFRRACASVQSRQNLRCSLIQALNQEEPSDRKPDPWPLWMAGHAQLKICHDGMLEDTNSLDGAQIILICRHNLLSNNPNTCDRSKNSHCPAYVMA